MNDPKNPRSSTSSATFLIELMLRHKLVQERESVVRKRLLGELDQWNRREAKACFDVLQEWNQLNELFTVTKNSLLRPDRSRYIADVLFLRDRMAGALRGPASR